MSPSRAQIRLAVLGIALGSGSLAPSCNRPAPAAVSIDTPLVGLFTTASSVPVQGRLLNASPDSVASFTINGAPVVIQADRTWSTTVTLDPGAIVNPIYAEAILNNGVPLRARSTVIYGESIADGDYSPMGVALRLDDKGLDEAEPLVEALAAGALDIEALLIASNPVATLFQCIIPNPFGGCLAGVTITVDVQNTSDPGPAASYGSLDLNVDSWTDFVAGDILVHDFEVEYDTDGIDCQGKITANMTTILGDYALQPDSIDPTTIDVNLTSPVDVSFSGFQNDFTGGICDFPIVGDIIALIIGNVEPIVRDGFEEGLADPDGAGPLDSPIADGIETALASIEISGPIGQAIGVNLETPLFDVYEDPNGITLDGDARITASQPDPNAFDQAASYHVPEAFPSFGATTPVGGLPYELGISISTSAFNQLLKAETESGLLIASITEVALFGGPPETLTAATLSPFFPQFGELDPATPLVLEIQPVLAPFLTGQAGPAGEIAEVHIPHLLLTLRTIPNNILLLRVAVDALAGIDLLFDAGELSFLIGALDPDVNISFLANTLGVFEVGVQNLLLLLLPDLLPALADSLGTFPLPDFLGLSLAGVEVSKNGEFLSIFADLGPAP